MKWCWEFPWIFRKPSDTRQGRGYHIIHHTYWLSWFKSDFVNSKANKVDIGGCYLNLFWCLIISQSYLLVTWLWPCHLSEGETDSRPSIHRSSMHEGREDWPLLPGQGSDSFWPLQDAEHPVHVQHQDAGETSPPSARRVTRSSIPVCRHYYHIQNRNLLLQTDFCIACWFLPVRVESKDSLDWMRDEWL